MSPRSSAAAGPAWVWMLPVIDVVHVVEEYALGGTGWASRTYHVSLTGERFWLINSLGFALFCILAVLIRARGASLGAPLLATVLLGDGATHIVSSALTRSYSPGEVTGALLWIPAGAALLAWSAVQLRGVTIAAGVLGGLILLAAVFAAAAG